MKTQYSCFVETFLQNETDHVSHFLTVEEVIKLYCVSHVGLAAHSTLMLCSLKSILRGVDV